jgi:purine-binding chemotaxis protein CheW
MNQKTSVDVDPEAHASRLGRSVETGGGAAGAARTGREAFAAASSQYATFHVDGLFFGVDVLDVQEVLRFHEMTRVPLAPPTIQGLINLRGQIVTAIDMRRRLALRPRPEGQVPMNVVIRSEEGAVSLLVDEIGDVVEVAEESREAVPENISGPQRELLTAVAKLDKRLLLVLNTQKLLQPGTAE